MHAKEYDPVVVTEFIMRHKQAKTNAQKKMAIDGFMQLTGVSRPTAYNVLKKNSRNIPVEDIAQGTQHRSSRKSEFELASIKKDMIRLAAIKQQPGEKSGKWIPTDRAIEIGAVLGYWPEDKWTRSTADRWLDYFGLNKKLTQKPARAKQKITAAYANECWLVDATPMDQYYLRLDLTPVHINVPDGDKHLDDLLRDENCVKIWVYYMVDMFSGAFMAWPSVADPIGVGSKNQGESAQSWINALQFFMLPKARLEPLCIKGEYRKHPFINSPVEGVPHILFSDKGSGIGGSNQTKSFLYNLGSTVRTHMPGNPSAKGRVEGRIGAFKRTIECQFLPEKIRTVDELVYLYCSWVDYYNRKKGLYDAYVSGLAGHAPLRVSPSLIQDALVVNQVRTISNSGTIRIDNEHWFVTADGRYIGTKVNVYKRVDRETGELIYTAETHDRKLFTCTHGLPEHHLNDRPTVEQTPEELNRAEAATFRNEVKRHMSYDDMLPPETEKKVVHIVPSVENARVNTASLPETLPDKQQAINWILFQTGLFWEEVPENTRTAVEHLLDIALKSGGVPRETLITISNTLNDDAYWEEQYQKQSQEKQDAN